MMYEKIAAELIVSEVEGRRHLKAALAKLAAEQPADEDEDAAKARRRRIIGLLATVAGLGALAGGGYAAYKAGVPEALARGTNKAWQGAKSLLGSGVDTGTNWLGTVKDLVLSPLGAGAAIGGGVGAVPHLQAKAREQGRISRDLAGRTRKDIESLTEDLADLSSNKFGAKPTKGGIKGWFGGDPSLRNIERGLVAAGVNDPAKMQQLSRQLNRLITPGEMTQALQRVRALRSGQLSPDTAKALEDEWGLAEAIAASYQDRLGSAQALKHLKKLESSKAMGVHQLNNLRELLSKTDRFDNNRRTQAALKRLGTDKLSLGKTLKPYGTHLGGQPGSRLRKILGKATVGGLAGAVVPPAFSLGQSVFGWGLPSGEEMYGGGE